MHLYSKYTHISANDMAANYKKLRFPYNVEESLTILVERLDECTDLSEAAVNPVTKTQLFWIVYGLVAETGKYPEYCWLWRAIHKKYCVEF